MSSIEYNDINFKMEWTCPNCAHENSQFTDLENEEFDIVQCDNCDKEIKIEEPE